MDVLGIWLAAVGVADMVAGSSGEVVDRSHAVAAVGVAALVAAAGAAGIGQPWPAAVALTLWSAASVAAWTWARLERPWSPRRASAILGAAAAATAATAASLPAWPEGAGPLHAFIEDLPFEALAGQPPAEVVAIAGAFLSLQATGNAVVRLILAMAGTPVGEQQHLRGGRFIGPMERSLIFGLGVAGQLTAAAVVATAKGLLRFPELSRESQAEIHAATEYFLIGSLASWLLPLALLILL